MPTCTGEEHKKCNFSFLQLSDVPCDTSFQSTEKIDTICFFSIFLKEGVAFSIGMHIRKEESCWRRPGVLLVQHPAPAEANQVLLGNYTGGIKLVAYLPPLFSSTTALVFLVPGHGGPSIQPSCLMVMGNSDPVPP